MELLLTDAVFNITANTLSNLLINNNNRCNMSEYHTTTESPWHLYLRKFVRMDIEFP